MTISFTMNRPNPSAAVIVCSGAADGARQAADAGANDYLAKPFTTEDLFNLIDEYF